MSKRYLAELDRALRRHRVSARRRRRFLAETEDHFSCDPAAATAFGDPDRLAEEIAAAERPRRTRLLTLVLAGAVVAFVVPLYGMPENTLPPAPAEGLPGSVAWKLDWAAAFYGAALVLAAVAFVFSLVRPRLAIVPACVAVSALVVSAALGSAAAIEWPVGGSTAVAAVVPMAAALASLALFVATRLASAAWPRRLR